MEALSTELDPNLNAEIYRNMTPADIPPYTDKHLQFILISEDSSAILGASNMTDRYWSGTVWFYKNDCHFDRDKASAGMKTKSGVCDACYLDTSDKFIIGEDSGAIRIMGVKEIADTQTCVIECLQYSIQHNDSITSISPFHNKKHLVAASMDYCIKVWDMQPLYASYTFNPAHTDIISCVHTKPESDSVFASTSLDNEALLWDIRQDKPAQGITKKGKYGLTALAWNPSMEHQVVIGDASGRITVLDTRHPNLAPLYKIENEFSRGVHKLAFNPDRPEQMAGCCDNTEIKVFNTNQDFNVIYQNNEHKDFVRGLAWHNNYLASASWDDTVIKHVIPSQC